MGSQPLAAASVTPFEKGATAVTTIGGCGCCKGLAIIPWPISVRDVLSVVIFQYLPSMLYGASDSHILRTVSIPSKNISFLLLSRVPNTSASDANPPGEIPKLNLPSNIWSNIATWPATCAGCEFGKLTVPVPRRICLVSAANEATKRAHEVIFSAASVTCSPTYASEKPSSSASKKASLSSLRLRRQSLFIG